MSAENQSQIGGAELVLADNNLGVGKTWFQTDSSAAGAAYGLIGALTTAIMDAIINSGPSKQAQKAADEVGELVSTDYLNNSFVEAVESALDSVENTSGPVTITSIRRQQLMVGEAEDSVLTVSLNYSLSEEASAMRVVADVSYENANLQYVSPYTFENGKIPKEQQDGAIYHNVFIYDSDRLELPVLSPELKEELVAQIRNRYTDEDGNLPDKESKERRRMEVELKQAADDELGKNEAAFFLITHWTENDGYFVFQEVTKAHQFIVEHLIQDMGRTDVPSLEGEDQIIATAAADGRTVRIVGNGTTAGTVISSSGNLDAPISIGNATSYSKLNTQRDKELRKAARAN